MHNNTDILSSVIKSARENTDITIEALAAKIGVSERYIYRIENEQKKPSFNVLLKLIQELAINSDLILYLGIALQECRGRRPYSYALGLR